MLIVIEGLDGSGKSTQVKKLRQYLGEKTGKLEYIHFPRYDAPVYGDLISRFLRGEFGSNEQVHPQLVALLFAEDRPYQCAKLDSEAEQARLRDWIIDTEYGAFGLPVPDLNIFLDVPVGFVEQKLTSSRGGSGREYLAGARDIHEADIEFQKKVRGIYLAQCQADPKFMRIDCSGPDGKMLPPEDVFKKIKAAADRIL